MRIIESSGGRGPGVGRGLGRSIHVAVPDIGSYLGSCVGEWKREDNAVIITIKDVQRIYLLTCLTNARARDAAA